MQLDLADLASVHALTKELLHQRQRLHYIILNAGGRHLGALKTHFLDESPLLGCVCRGNGMPARKNQARL